MKKKISKAAAKKSGAKGGKKSGAVRKAGKLRVAGKLKKQYGKLKPAPVRRRKKAVPDDSLELFPADTPTPPVEGTFDTL